MKYVQLGNTDLKVSKVCLGCMGFGDASKGMHSWTLPYDESKKMIKYALDQGINFFDTAMAYQGGTSEIYLGKAIKEYANRADVVIATKFHGRTKEQIQQGITAKEHIETCLNNSLKRLQMDYVDLYILHAWDNLTPIEETLEALNEVVRQGKVRYIGVSNCYAWQIAKANEIAKRNGWAPFVSVQGHYNLIFREEEREMKPYCDLHNVALTPYSSLASGRLAKHPGESSKRMQEDTYAKGKYDATADADLKIIKRVEELSQKKNVSMTEISLAWLMNKVCSPIVGATKTSHIDGAVKATNLILSDDEMNYLEELYVPHALVGVMASNK
ncbi:MULTISPECIES: aldo/keto reductase [Coprobacillaceae]|uniref:aldo/keto reductase n=1 Tax=Coprobacillaceae TaxID=2810280 RepID=UPI000E4B715C|nr:MULTISPECIES: aldo/keto reductase [Coprobacillaceae]RHM63706.1 aldo/keto reductase [Coprobacillus sp. AF33-1AC]RHS96435.1 aldo/keto reductase [Erysipelatoclostridium sp. AM42-17]